MLTNKYVLILGAGLMQKPALEAAKSLGYKTLVIDADPHALCVPFADTFVQIDLKDTKAIAELALEYKDSLAAVFTAGTDFSANTSYAAKKAGLLSHEYEAALNASDKARMRSCFKKMNVPSPEFQKIHRSEIASFIADGTFDSITFPKVVKPVDNMGGRGCRLVRKKSELLNSLEDAVRASRSSCAILEDYMHGNEYSIDAIVYENSVTITGFADRHIFFPPYFIETGHTMPSKEEEGVKLELIKTFVKGIKALGLTCGAAKADIKMTENGPMIGEIAARLSGGYMSGWTYPFASGINLTGEALKIAAGDVPESILSHRIPLAVSVEGFSVYEVPCQAFSAERSWISIPGTVKELYGLARANASPFVKNVFVRSMVGDEVDFPRNNVQKCGNVISAAPTRELAVEASCNAAASVVLRLEPKNKKTDSFLKGRELPHEKGFPYAAYNADEDLKNKVMSFARQNPEIKKGVSLASYFGGHFVNEFSELKDFNYRSVLKTFNMFDELCADHVDLNAAEFFRILFRGGLQGILYMNDTLRHHRA